MTHRLRLWTFPLWLGAALPAQVGQEPAPPTPAPVERPQDPAGTLGIPQGANVGREQMWYAPTAEDWQKPVPIQWQRTWDDAVRLSKETNRPILVCVNMDGEIASEHYAGVRYRQPDIAKLYEPYVCVIASVYRHNPRDYDEQGRRIPCPRFGCVTCGEHIAIEPILYEKFMDGRRIAPRHIMVELDGKETYDVFYAFDTASVFSRIKDGMQNRPDAPPPIVRGDRSLLEKVGSADSRDRSDVEVAFEQADPALKKSLLEAALAAGKDAPVDLVRLGLYALDQDLNQQARKALAQSRSEGAADLIDEALRVPMADAEREQLLAGLQQLAASSPRARTLNVVHQGLGSRSAVVNVDAWAQQLAASYQPAFAPERSQLLTAIDERAAAAKAQNTGEAKLLLAEALLADALSPQTQQSLAADPRSSRHFTQLMFEDVQRTALEAEKLGATGWRLAAAKALAAQGLGKHQDAYVLAEAAVRDLPPDAPGLVAMHALALFAEARQEAIVAAVRARQEWPPQWLTDVHATYSVLARHPLGTDQQVCHHYDFLKHFGGGGGRADSVLEAGLLRFPESAALHERLRNRVLERRGVAALLATYEGLLQKQGSPNMQWFAGYAAMVAAEFHRRQGRADDGIAAYDKARALFDQAIAGNPECKGSADHYAAMALGGQARVRLERGDLDAAATAVVQSFERSPEASNALDGLNLSTVDTAKMLLVKAKEGKRDDVVATVQAALGKLDPSKLQLPAYEFETPPPGQQGGQPPRRGGRRG